MNNTQFTKELQQIQKELNISDDIIKEAYFVKYTGGRQWLHTDYIQYVDISELVEEPEIIEYHLLNADELNNTLYCNELTQAESDEQRLVIVIE